MAPRDTGERGQKRSAAQPDVISCSTSHSMSSMNFEVPRSVKPLVVGAEAGALQIFTNTMTPYHWPPADSRLPLAWV